MVAYIDSSSRRIVNKDLVDRIIYHLCRIFLEGGIYEFIVIRIS